MILIIDYGMGNLRSVAKAFEYLGADVTVSKDVELIKRAEKLVLPGVGSFADGMKNLLASGLVELIKEAVIKKGTPIMGICLGMQLLATLGYEGGETTGLSLINGRVIRLEASSFEIKLPQVGWNNIRLMRANPLIDKTLDEKDFYFVHSYHMVCDQTEDVIATAEYGVPYVAAVKKGNIFATQFHPEKSQLAGLRIIENYLDWDGQ